MDVLLCHIMYVLTIAVCVVVAQKCMNSSNTQIVCDDFKIMISEIQI